MKQTTLTLTLLPVAAALLLSGKPAAAQIELDLQKPVQSGTAGNTFQFFGTITNYGSSPVFVSGDTYTPLAPGLTLDDSPSYNIPAQFSAFGTGPYSYYGELFDVTVAPGTDLGSYSGTFSLTGGADPIANYADTLVTKHFGITVAAVPEASTTVSFALLLSLGLGGLMFAARKKKAASAA